MKYLMELEPRSKQAIHLFHPTAELDEEALGKLASDAAAAGVKLHVLVDTRDGLLNGERIRAEVPEWRSSSLWFCGPTGLGKALRRDFARVGFDLNHQFHQELFAMR
jgi:predicted ferric reductase